MSRLLLYSAIRRIAAAAGVVLLVGCRENFPDAAAGPGEPVDPAPSAASLDVRDWADTLVLGAEHPIEAVVLDQDGQPMPDETVTWTIGTPGVLGAAAGTGDSVRLDALALGTSQITFTVQGRPELTATRHVTVLVGGVAATTAQDTTLTGWPDTAVVIASALGYSGGGPTLAPFASQGVTWTRQGSGAVTLLENSGDTVRVVAAWNTTDTLIATHSQCLAGAVCVDTVVITVNAPLMPGGDVVTYQDVDVTAGAQASAAGNQTFVDNIIGFTNSQPRAAGMTAMFYNGSSSACSTDCTSTATSAKTSGFISKLTALGYTLIDETSSLAAIPADVKLIFIFTPRTNLSTADVNGLKQFAKEGGRVVVVGEVSPYPGPGGGFGTAGINAVNQLFTNLGVSITSTNAFASSNTATTESAHQLVAGVSQILGSGIGTMTLGANATALGRAGTGVNYAVARIDTTPLP